MQPESHGRGRRLALVAAFALIFASAASATIVATIGDAVKINPPPSVEFGDLESDTTMFAFDEQQCVRLTEDLVVDVTEPGSYPPDALTGGVIPAGTLVSSHFIHTDNIGEGTGTSANYLGSVVVDAPILGIIFTQQNLDASDFLGAPGTDYPTGERGRDLEVGHQPSDVVIMHNDGTTTTVHSEVTFHADQVRIITECVEQNGGEGCTPGFWKQPQHFDSWPAGLEPSDLFEDVFNVEAFPTSNPTLLKVLSFSPYAKGVKQLARQATAALLNALSADVDFGLTSTQVIEMTRNAILSGNRRTIEATKNQLESFNEQVCPLD